MYQLKECSHRNATIGLSLSLSLSLSLDLKHHIERVNLLLVAGVAHVGNLHELEVFSVSEKC